MKVKKALLIIAAVLIARKVYLSTTAKPLSSELKQDGIEPNAIDRAISRITTGDVKVNSTPEETKKLVA